MSPSNLITSQSDSIDLEVYFSYITVFLFQIIVSQANFPNWTRIIRPWNSKRDGIPISDKQISH